MGGLYSYNKKIVEIDRKIKDHRENQAGSLICKKPSDPYKEFDLLNRALNEYLKEENINYPLLHILLDPDRSIAERLRTFEKTNFWHCYLKNE